MDVLQIQYSYFRKGQTKIIQAIIGAPFNVSNQMIHLETIQQINQNYHQQLESQTNTLIQPLLLERKSRRLKRNWKIDLK